MSFSIIGKAVGKQFQAMTATGLYRVEVDKDKLWENYLASFPEGSNPIYKQRTEHDCQCCRSFIRALGGVVTIANGKLVSIWDVDLKEESPYQDVVDSMSLFVKKAFKSNGIDNVFLHNEPVVGTANSRQLLEDKSVITWDHFFVNLPTAVVVKGVDIGPKLADTRSTKDVMYRSLCEINTEAIDMVLELIAQNSLYRGEEHKFAVEGFQTMKRTFDKLKSVREKELFCWSNLKTFPASVSRIRSTVIGTLLTDLSEGKELEDAVKMFESKVAPTNYKRPKALITKAMIQKAQAKLDELGFTTALERRYATIDDITINNILFADRTAKKAMNVFDELAAKVPEKSKKLDKVEEVNIEDFITKILPKAESIEVMFENKHASNLVSLVAPADPTAKCMFKWPNNFSWSYAGEVTDSIKERVKRAGGNVTGDFRASLSWHNYDDLDLHLIEPDRNEIYYANKRSYTTGGHLDVDMNAGGGRSRNAVENIVYPERRKMVEGTYKLIVNQFAPRETIDLGFEVEMEFEGVIHSFAYQKRMSSRENVIVAEFKYTHKNGIEILTSLPSTQASRTTWGIPTQTFHKVNVMMLSPNYWGAEKDLHAEVAKAAYGAGNKHYFFMLDGCLNEGKARGFFNEFLTEDLNQHRKVFEVVGAKMKTDESDRQLSGLGFSSTQRNELLCRIKGAFTRTIKITF